MKKALTKKIDYSVKLLQATTKKDGIVEICYSGGKDSDVILELAKMAGIKYRAIYKNTTIDPPRTIQHCIDNGVEIIKPKISFLDLVKKKGMPTRRARFCCEFLKEYKILDTAVQGIRLSESSARRARYDVDDPIICRIYGVKENHCNVCLPILDWNDNDVKDFIADRGIKCHPLYYDEDGIFRVERRLGCIGCPLTADNGRGDYKKYPKFFKQVVKAVCTWWNNHPYSKSHLNFENPYALIAHNLFFHSYNDWKMVDDGLFGKTDWKKSMECFFNIKL